MDVQIEEEFKEFENTGITKKMLDDVMGKVPVISLVPVLFAS